jgi:hypothetical protein
MYIVDEIKLLPDFLSQGRAFSVDGLRFEVIDNNLIEIIGWSNYTHLRSITRTIALQELEAIQILFKSLLKRFQSLSDFFDGKNLKYSLWFDDYSKGSLVICSTFGETIDWLTSI